MKHNNLNMWITLLILLLTVVLPPFFTQQTLMVQAEKLPSGLQKAAFLKRALDITPWNQPIADQLALLYAERPGRLVNALSTQASLGWLSPVTSLGYANASIRIGKVDEGILFLQGLVTRNEMAPSSHLALASQYHRRGDFGHEWQVLQAGQALTPNNKELASRLLLLSAAYGKPPGNSDPNAYANARQAQILLTAVQTRNLLQRNVAVGMALLGMGEDALAEIAFERAVQDQPALGDIWAWLAISRARSNPTLADATMQTAWTKPQHGPQFAYLQGQFALARGDQHTAAKVYAAILQQEPENINALIGFGIATADSNMIAALAALEKASQLAPSDSQIWRTIGEICVRNNAYLQQTALPAIANLQALQPAEAHARILHARAALALGDQPTVLAELDQASQLATHTDELAEILFVRALLYVQQGRIQDALNSLQDLTERYPDSASYAQAHRLAQQLSGSVR